MAEFTAVVTTGIYCRRGCPATPLRRNTRPYLNAAAAEAGGFRPCLRCRPDQQPAPTWIDAPELVCRALGLIADGALDGATENELGAQLGVSARHLRRLFDNHVGATPAEVARSRRAHFARRLLDDTDLAMRDVARAAGFQSVRQMNRVMQSVFRFTPSALRARRRDPHRLVADGGLRLRLPYRPPYAWRPMLAFLAARAVPGVESVDHDAGVYRRTVRVDDEPGVIEVRDEPGADALSLTVHLSQFDGLAHLVARIRRQFDVDADTVRIDAHLDRDARLRRAGATVPGLRLPGALDPLEIAVRAALGQQVTLTAGSRLTGRLVGLYGTPVPGLEPLGLTHLFPTAAALGQADHAEIGTTRARADTIRELAAVVPGLGAGSLRELVTALRAIRGVGPWTAQYVAMRGFSEPDAFPAHDLGLRRAAGGLPASALEGVAEPWRPWRAYAAVRLWSISAGDGRFPA